MAQELLAAIHGIRRIYFGIIDPKTGKVITGPEGVSDTGFTYVDGDGQGATQANVTALEEKGTKKYANNQVKRIAHGIPAPEVAVIMLDMPFDLMRKLLGYVKSGTAWVPNTGVKPHVAMIIESDSYDGNRVYDAFANGEVIMPTRNHGTDNNNQTESDPTLTYDALAPIDDATFVDGNGNQSIVGFYNSGETDFLEQTMFDEVFPGNTAGSSTPSDNKATISVHYQDDSAQAVAGLSDTTVKGNIGDTYTIPTPEVSGYTYEKTTVPLNGKFTSDQSAVVTYKKNSPSSMSNSQSNSVSTSQSDSKSTSTSNSQSTSK